MEDARPDYPDISDRKSRQYLALCGFVGLLTAGLVTYSVTMSFVWDEGFHILAGMMIDAGKRLYIDFAFPQTPLNAYWNAGVLRIFPYSWRAIHVLAALLTSGSVLLTADYVFVRFPDRNWRLAAAMTAAALLAFNHVVVYFATVGQAYAMCLLLVVAAFRATMTAVDRPGLGWAAAAGFFASAGPEFSLLTAAASPVLLIWMLYYNRAGTRVKKFAAYVGGSIIPMLPLAWLFLRAPQQTFFNVLQYQALYRRVNWGNAVQHDLEVTMGWTDNLPAIFLGLLAVAGFVFLVKRSDWSPALRAEFYLSAWLVFGLSAEIATAHPTFERYFLLAVPFVAILAAIGIYSIGSRLNPPARPLRPAALLIVMLAMSLGKRLYDDRDASSWQQMEQVAPKVAEVTPAGAGLWADEMTYFLLHRLPPEGMQFQYAHKMELPEQRARLLHVISAADVKRQLAAGVYDTVETCEDSDWVKEYKLNELFQQKEELDDCTVFWDKKVSPK